MRNLLILLVLFLGLDARAWAAVDGALLFSKHCAACHGDHGEGGVGVPLALPSFLATVDDAFLGKTIRLGRPGRVMPSFTGFNDAQLQALVKHIRGWSDLAPPEFPAQSVAGDPRHGQLLFLSHCGVCHGAEGEGGRGTGVTFSRPREFPIIAPALDNPGFQAAASDAMIKHTLLEGRQGTPMPSFADRGLSAQDLNDIVAFIRTLGRADGVPEGKPDLGPKALRARSPYGFAETLENVREAIVNQNFVLIREVPLEQGLVPAGDENQRQVIFHFCNFKFLNDALAIDPRIGMFLPCRVTVTQGDAGVEVTAVNPMRLSRLFNNDELTDLCLEMYEIYQTILEDLEL